MCGVGGMHRLDAILVIQPPIMDPSHIDLGLGNATLHVLDSYKPRLLSDHSSFRVRLDVTVSLTRTLWWVNPFWLTLFPSSDSIPGALIEFIRFNRGSASTAVVWDSLKAFLRGCLIWGLQVLKDDNGNGRLGYVTTYRAESRHW